MTRFNYPFQRILDVKEKETQNAQLNMAKAIQKQEKIEHSIDELLSKISEVKEKLDNKQSQGISITELRMMENYVEYLHKHKQTEENQLFLAKKNVAKKQEVLRDAWKEEKTWNVLKDKKKSEFVEKLKILEEQQLNEISSQLYFRQMGCKG